jgi:hypothetical protein
MPSPRPGMLASYPLRTRRRVITGTYAAYVDLLSAVGATRAAELDFDQLAMLDTARMLRTTYGLSKWTDDARPEHFELIGLCGGEGRMTDDQRRRSRDPLGCPASRRGYAGVITAVR